MPPTLDHPATLHCNETGAKVSFQIAVGQDFRRTAKMDREWSLEKSVAFNHLIEKYGDKLKDQAILYNALTEYNLADFHWRWLEKAIVTSTDEYEWFYLEVNDSVQGVCIIFHPKSSRLDAKDIFYIDYIAAAYWNRNRPDNQKKYSNVGRLLISHTIQYAIDILGFRPGFCLHSLPTSETYYEGLGITKYEPDPAKQDLRYFEACESCALALSKVPHG
jgi:hypothetical protein